MNPDIHELPPPSDPTVFESLCLDLWKDIWQDSGAQKYGRRGQNQDGVDIFGQYNRDWIGVQCKQKDGLLRTRITPKELEDEVADARNFKPPLGKFILATTGARDEKVQERARQLTDENQSKHLFAVEVWSWREIWPEFCRRPELFNRVGPQYWPYAFQKTFSSLHQLLPLPTLYGRDEQLAELENQLTTSSKWFGLQGMGGVGKTALAMIVSPARFRPAKQPELLIQLCHREKPCPKSRLLPKYQNWRERQKANTIANAILQKATRS